MVRKNVCLSTLAITVFMLAGSGSAQMIERNGAIVDSANLPRDHSSGLIDGEKNTAAPEPNDPDWGTADYVTYTVGPGDFVRRWNCPSNGLPSTINLVSVIPAVGESAICVGAPVHLPSGALLDYVRLHYFDDIPGGDPGIGLYSSEGYNPPVSVTGLVPASSDGGDQIEDVGPLGHTVVRRQTEYHVLAILDRNGSQYEGIYKISFWYYLQISPAPGVATFPDVSTSFWAFQEIEALAASGITTGFPDGTFRPTAAVTRAQMATFLARALGLHWDY